ncbi:MAG: 6-phosphogluconolactonase [Deltaproteobacteria bacterium]|nr:MAG: 6-phosphogluconolactonase [Deltaproteobacteria bacterium]
MTPTMPPAKVYVSADALAYEVAKELMNLASNHSSDRPFSIALSGGSTPKRLYKLFGQEPFRSRMPWDKVAFYFGDERSVPPEDEESNFRMARETFLDSVPSAHYRMEADSGKAQEYEALLDDHLPKNEAGLPTFDVVLLGIGTDGHTASLFPGTKALHESQRWVVMNEVPQLGTVRMTLTYPVINAAHNIWVLASGASKQRIVQGVFSPTFGTPDWPICSVQPTHGSLRWWLDTEAAQGTAVA